MDLSETGAPRNSKLVSMESKDKLIMASNGSLVSSSKTIFLIYSKKSLMNFVVRTDIMIELAFAFILDSADNDVNEEQKKEKIAELKNKQKSLNEILALKEEELKKICLREAVSGLSYIHTVF